MGMNDEISVALSKEELNIIFLLDTSGSMTGERITQLNCAMQDAMLALKNAAMKEEVDLRIRVIEFNNFAQWIMGSAEEGLDIEAAESAWSDLSAKNAGTNTADAILRACEAMHTKYLGTSNYHPIVILVTDGGSDDRSETIAAINKLKSSLRSASDPAKEKIQRIALGVIQANQAELEDFASIGDIEHSDGTREEDVPLVFNVDNVAELSGLLKSITVSSIVSSLGGSDNADQKLVIMPESSDEDDDWEE